MSLFRPKFIAEWLDIRREGGVKLLIKKKGWQVIVGLIVFYLIRDTILYIIIPFLIYIFAKGIF